jgi:O-antigen ligase
VAGAGAVALAAWGAVAAGRAELFLGAAVLAAGAAVVYLGLRVEPAWPLSLGIAASIFSGHSERLGFPIGPDRLLIATGLLGVALAARREARRPAFRLEAAHWLLLGAFLWALASAWWAGTLTTSVGFFALLDRFGLVPFLAFLVAPLAFRTDRQRAVLLGTLVATGGYLGLTALFEALELHALVFPGYIVDDSVGIHAERVRGPFAQAVAMGLGLFICGAAALMGAARWRRSLELRGACVGVGMLCALGLVFTLTRAIWLGALGAALVVVLATPRLWRFVPAAGFCTAVLVVGALAFVPGLRDSAQERSRDRSPVWVRENTNTAALAIVADRPLFGIGWERFPDRSPPWFRQDENIPMTGAGEGVHNVLLANASELGLPGAFLWFAGTGLAIGGALVRRVAPALAPWKALLLGVTVMIAVAGSVGPLNYPFPLLVLWTLAGLMGSSSATAMPPPAARSG